MGILNLTPDSFYDGGKYVDSQWLNSKLQSLLKADIIDIGAESSRPNATPLDIGEEKDRISTIFDWVSTNSGKVFSIDSYKPEVAKFALDNGFNMINDITGGGSDFAMLEISAEYNVPICIMHMQGLPETMQVNPMYDDILDSLKLYFEKRINTAVNLGVSERNLILDPGIGFGKRIINNDLILANLNELKTFGYPILLGVSRKSFLEVENDIPNDRLSASIATATLAVLNGANILRVHDVDETIKAVRVLNRIQNRKIEMEVA